MKNLALLLIAACAAPSSPTSNALSIIVEPSDSGQALLDAINSAQRSVHVTMYLLSNDAVQQAIAARAKAGLDVGVVLDKHSGLNASAYDWLEQHGVSVVWAPEQFAFTHEKCVILDGSSAWIMTMNASHDAPLDNREYLAIDTEPGDVAEAEAVFSADFAGHSFSARGKLLVAPLNARSRIEALVASAGQSLDLEVEELSDVELAKALCAASARGVAVRALVEAEDASSEAITTLGGCATRVMKMSTPYLHAKAIVADGSTAYVGSINFSAGSMDDNRELGLITTNSAAVSAIAQTLAADFASATPTRDNPASARYPKAWTD